MRNWKPLSACQLEILIKCKDGWIVRNLLQYGNSLLPKRIVDAKGVEGTKERLERIVGKELNVYQEPLASPKEAHYIVEINRIYKYAKQRND